MDTRISGTLGEDDSVANGSLPHFSREAPRLEPLPKDPTPLDVAVRYGTFAIFVLRQWPAMYDAWEGTHRQMQALRNEIASLKGERGRHWIWPFATALFLAAAIAGWWPRLFGAP